MAKKEKELRGMQESIFDCVNEERIQQCDCGRIKGKKTILANFVRVGITTEFQDNGVFKNHHSLCIENNYCPQCGKKYRVRNIE